jgi:hypothetical protein
MANIENLQRLTSEKAKEIGSIGGKKSAAAAKRRKTMREMLDYLLTQPAAKKKDVDTLEAILVAAIKKAQKGNIKAMEFIRDTVGEKPVDRLSGNINLTQALVVFEAKQMTKDENADSNGEDSGKVQATIN